MNEAYGRGDELYGDICNANQLAIKVSMNSVYGDLGSTTSPLSCKAISSCVTYNGRCMIDWSKQCAETWYNGAKNGYSDSIHGDENVWIKDSKGNRKKMKIRAIGKKWRPFVQNGIIDPDKEQGESSYMIKTKGGWTIPDRVIRHRTRKKILTICTETGKLRVTEDHPMILEDGTKKRAKDLQPGDSLMTCNF